MKKWQLLLSALCTFLITQPAQAAQEYRFNINRIGIGERGSLRSALIGQTRKIHYGINALNRAGNKTKKLARQIHKLMPRLEDYSKVLITPNHVSLTRKDGLHEVYRRWDAEKHLASRKPLVQGQVTVGHGWRGQAITAKTGLNNTIFLYRQLPGKAEGQISSTDINTSFALGKQDAYHPFGTPGNTVRIALPASVLNRAIEGREGAVGWNNLGDGYSTGLEVLTEVQLCSRRVGKLFN